MLESIFEKIRGTEAGSMKDKFLGCFYGLAVGDALGFATEPFSLRQIKQTYGKVVDFESRGCVPKARYSDDTGMSLALANAVLLSPDYEVDTFMEYVRKEFIAWSKSDLWTRGPGRTCLSGCRNMEEGIPWRSSGISYSKGCGSCMRVSALSLFFHNDIEKLFELTCAASICTHAHPTAVAAGVGTAYAIALSLNGENPAKIIDLVCEIPQPTTEYIEKIQQVKDVLKYDPEVALPILGDGWIGGETLALSLYLFNKFPNCYVESVLGGVNTNGDSDSIASITGSLSGARNGATNIPAKWIKGVEGSKMIGKIARSLYQKHHKKTIDC
jgi:ADP-ribosylglycohydrolase